MFNNKDTFKALFISHVNPSLRSAGNEIRILKMINWLREEGVNVILLLNHPPLSDEKRNRLLEVVDFVHTPADCIPSFTKRIQKAANRILFRQKMPKTKYEEVRTYLCPPSLIQATGILCKRYRPKAVFSEYVFTTPCLREVLKGSLRIVDTHDMFSMRNPNEAVYCSHEEEREYLLNAEVVIAIQPHEAEKFRAMVPERKVVTVGVDYEVVPPPDQIGGVRKHTVLVVGSQYPANIEGLKAFCEYAWPQICKENPRAELVVAGRIGEGVLNNIPQVRVLGWVENINDLYLQSAVVINPTVTGTGLKIKTIEALCNSKPLIATPNAIEGLVCDGEPPWIVCDNWPDFAKEVISLLENENRQRELQESAFRYAQGQFDKSNVYSQLKNILWA